MSTLAQILYDLGNEVSVYDDAKGHKFTQDGLEKRDVYKRQLRSWSLGSERKRKICEKIQKDISFHHLTI